MTTSNDLKKGMVLKIGSDLFSVMWYEHHKPGKGGAIVRVKMRNIRKDTVLERTFRAGEPLEDVFVENKEVQLLYKEGEDFVFMDTTSFEQYHVSGDLVGDSAKYLKNEMICSLDIFEEEIIGVEPPMFVDLEVTETDPGLRGDTASGGSKPATVETGAVVTVPLFVTTGERIRIDTRDDRYIERVK